MRKANIISLATILFLTTLIMNSFSSENNFVKNPNVSGQFYSDNPERLSENIDSFFNSAKIKPYDKHIDVIIVPHAGYVYSGGVAAYGFKAASLNKYNTVIILAASHFFGFDGISVWAKGSFKTPLGSVDVDHDFAEKLLSSNDKIIFEPKAFEREHSLEVEIPFAQKTFKDFKIVPVIMGQAGYGLVKEFAETLNVMVGDRRDVLLVVSSDMSHYHDDTFARKMDASTLDILKSFDIDRYWKECQLRTKEMCGFVPATAGLLFAKNKGLTEIDILKYANSGDVTGDKGQVVGYSSVVIHGNEKLKDGDMKESPNDETLTLEQKKKLIDIAKKAIEGYVRNGETPDISVDDKRLMKNEGAFVTLHKNGQLRGCIGHIIGRQPLYLTVRDMAIAAATQDSRFTRVTEEELSLIDLEISVLSEPKVANSVDEIIMGVHGVIVSQKGAFGHGGVFLPQVATETGWNKEEFLSQLCSQKARLPRDAWKDPQTKLEIFTADVFSENDLK